MLGLRTLLLALIAALFAVSGGARALPLPAAEAPCHEAPAQPDKSRPAGLAISCCAACLPAPPDALVSTTVFVVERPTFTVVQARAEGQLTAPDPRPPRLI